MRLIIKAGVRYWEDAIVNGIEDVDGTLIPFRRGNLWCPVIDIETGIVQDWPSDKTADVHYKVCDAGDYWIVDPVTKEQYKFKGDYVPDLFLCHVNTGYGDYIILKIDNEGKIANYKRPTINKSEWQPCDS